MDKQLEVAFKSQRKRINAIRNFYTSQPFFTFFRFLADVKNLDAQFGAITSRTVVKTLYSEKKTNTYIFKLSNPDSEDPIICKVYRIRSKTDAHNMEIRYLKLLSGLIIQNITPHITLPIARMIAPMQDVTRMFSNIEKTDPGNYHIMLSEFADAGTLTDLINKTKIGTYQFRCILFQVFQTILSIQTQIPNFRHRDLHSSNVLVQHITCQTGYTEYFIDGVRYYHDISLCPYRILFWDLYYSQSSTKISEYEDIHKLLDSIYWVVAEQKSPRYTSSLKEVLDFIDFVVPDNLKCMINNKDSIDIKLPTDTNITPKSILEHAFFMPMQVRPPKNLKLLERYQLQLTTDQSRTTSAPQKIEAQPTTLRSKIRLTPQTL